MDYLNDKSQTTHSKTILISHQALAREMGTTREVVSRTLKKLEQEKRLQLAFKKIELNRLIVTKDTKIKANSLLLLQ